MCVYIFLEPFVLPLQLVSSTSYLCYPRPGSCPGSSTDPRWSSTTTWSRCPTSRTLQSTPLPFLNCQTTSRQSFQTSRSSPCQWRVRPRAKEVRVESDRENIFPVATSVTLGFLCYTSVAICFLFYLCVDKPLLKRRLMPPQNEVKAKKVKLEPGEFFSPIITKHSWSAVFNNSVLCISVQSKVVASQIVVFKKKCYKCREVFHSHDTLKAHLKVSVLCSNVRYQTHHQPHVNFHLKFESDV